MESAKSNTKNKIPLTGVFIIALIILIGIGYYTHTGYFAYTTPPAEQQVIKIGHIGPLTGFAAFYGEQEMQGIDLAVSEINAKGGIKGKKLVVIHEDDQLDPTSATSALNKLITVDKVPAVIGELSSTITLALAPIAERNKVILMSHGANSNKISSAGDYIFRIYPTNALEAKKLVELSSSLNLTDGAIIYGNNDFGTDLAQSVNDEFTKNGGTISISEGYAPDATDFRTQLTKIQAKNPKVIFLLGYSKDMAIVLKQARELGIKSQFLAPDTFSDPQIIEQSGSASEGVIVVYPANGDPTQWPQFNQKINSTYGKEAGFVTAMAYDATNLLAVSMQNSGTTSDDIKTGLYQIKDYPGVTGTITFDKNGDVVTRLFILKIVKDGKFQDYK